MERISKAPNNRHAFKKAAIIIGGTLPLAFGAFTFEMWYKIPYWMTAHPAHCTDPERTAGVVFTGTAERIEPALKKLGRNYNYLLISGTNPKFAESPEGRRILHTNFGNGIYVSLESSSKTTEDNGDNTAKWLKSLNIQPFCAVLLFTSEAHGVRAADSLLKAVKQFGDTAIDVFLVADHTSNGGTIIKEMFKVGAAKLGIRERGPGIIAFEKTLDYFSGLAKRPQDKSPHKRKPAPNLDP